VPGEAGDPESFHPKSKAEWRRWLKANHESARRVWVILTKKGATTPGVLYEDAVEEALCFGWIDSRTIAADADRYMLQMTPRKPGSVWSKSNKQRVKQLIQDGRMTAAGLAKIEAAKKDGSWTRLDKIDRLEIPGDLKLALASNLEAKRNFEAFSDSAKKIILFWITAAKRDETRRKRVEETVRLAAANIKAAHPR
jgi:uncharacterized protein YdeI (YjbR/CyaY-like superfamily)